MKALVLAANEPDPILRLQRLEKTLDVERFLSFMAMEIMTFHWDGYCLKRNNYRVYHDLDTGKIVFFPHGMDQMFWEPNFSIQPQMEGLVARAIMTTSEGRRRYKERVATLLTNVFRVDALTNRINQVRARIRPELAAINPNAARDHDGQVQRIRDLIIQRAAGIEKQLSLPEPKPLLFDGAGMASLSGWRVQNELSNAQLDKSTDAEKKQTLHIHAGSDGRCTASWRTRVLLESGRYLFQAQVRTAGMVPLKDEKGEGAGVRISGSKEARPNRAVNETTWKKVEYEFPVPPGTDEVELVCELRAAKGDAWFDLDSLKLIRKGQ